MTRVQPLDAEPITVESLYRDLRHQILIGKLRPGSILSQVKLADAFGTGRTPLREALRMLQREGLVDAEYNRRVRVTTLTTSELDQIYARRVVLEAMAVRATIRRFADQELERLAQLQAAMESCFPDPTPTPLPEAWEQPHREFHRLLISHAGDNIVHDVIQLQDHAARYRAILGKYLPASYGLAVAEHAALVVACRQGDILEAGRILASHLARSGLALISQANPTHDAVALREALRLVVDNAPSNAPAADSLAA